MSNPVLDRLVAERANQIELMDGILAQVENESRDLVDAETRNLEAIRERIDQIDKQTEGLVDFEQKRAAAVAASSTPAGYAPARVESRSHEYRTAGEVMADGFRAVLNNDEQAMSRIESAGLKIENGVLQRAIPHTTTGDASGILPTPIVEGVMRKIDADRPFLNTVGVRNLAGIPGTSFSIPYVSENLQVGLQTAEKAEVEDGRLTISSVQLTKATYGGWTNVSKQVMDWTSPDIWNELLANFEAVYAKQTELAAVTALNAQATVGNLDVVDPAAPTFAEIVTGVAARALTIRSASGQNATDVWVDAVVWKVLEAQSVLYRATTGGDGGGVADLGNLSMTMGGRRYTYVPDLDATTTAMVVGAANRFAAYEDRFGFLQAVEPKVFGTQLAYGGYFASKLLTASAAIKVELT